MRDLKGRTAVITGGASGIGRGAALALAAQGVRVVVADIDLNGAVGTANMIQAAGGEGEAFACDVGEDAAFVALRDFTLDRFGGVHIVMNNVGGITRGLPDQIPIEEWSRLLNLNLLSVVRSNLTFLPILMAQGEGHVVNTASFAGLFTYAFDRLPYAASKAAIVQISEGLMLYLQGSGVGVTCLCPGPVATGIGNSVRSFGPATDTRGPGVQFGLKQPEDVGMMVVDAIRNGRFMVPTDDQVDPLLVARASDWDGFLRQQANSPHIAMKAQ